MYLFWIGYKPTNKIFAQQNFCDEILWPPVQKETAKWNILVKALLLMFNLSERMIHLHNDVVDWNMDEFNKESNESHDRKTNSSGKSNFLEFFK